MDVTQLRPGALIEVPRDADLIVRAPYRLLLTRVPEQDARTLAANAPYRYVLGRVFRVSGRPTVRRHDRHAWIDPTACKLISAAPTLDDHPGDRPGGEQGGRPDGRQVGTADGAPTP